MQDFSNSWRNFLNESRQIEESPNDADEIRVKLISEERLLREISEDELGHIQKAIDHMAPEDLAFYSIFGDKKRLIIDFPTIDLNTELGEFIHIWDIMGYNVDWDKGTIYSEREIISTSPEGLRKRLEAALTPGSIMPTKQTKINMKIGKWLSKMRGMLLKLKEKKNVIVDYLLRRYDDEWQRRSPVSPGDIKAAFNEDDRAVSNYYRLVDQINMMTDGMPRSKNFASVDTIERYIRYWQTNAAAIKKYVGSAKPDTFSIIVTRDPIDILRMADFDNITSCHSPPSRGGGDSYYKCAVAEAHGHGAMAYVVYTDDLLNATATETIEEAESQIQTGEVFVDEGREQNFDGTDYNLRPLSRLRLRQIMRAEIDEYPRIELAIPEQRAYGEDIPGFQKRLTQWARETQKETMDKIREEPPPVDGELNFTSFYSYGGSYSDSSFSDLVAGLFNVKRIYGRININTDTEDNLDTDLLGGLLRRYQLECDEISDRYNNRMEYTSVTGQSEDAGDGTAYIEIGAEIYLKWPASDWTRLPDRTSITYAIEEAAELGGISWLHPESSYLTREGAKPRHSGGIFMLRIQVTPENLVGFGGQAYAFEPGNYEEFCQAVEDEVDDKYETVKAILTHFFKRDGHMYGGAVMQLGSEVINGDMDLIFWEAEAEEGYELGEFEIVQFTAYPEIHFRAAGASEEQTDIILGNRNFWIKLKERLAAPAFETTGFKQYPNMPHDMQGQTGPVNDERGSVAVSLVFSVHDDSSDKQVMVLENMVNHWDDQEALEHVVNIVFREMFGDGVPTPTFESYDLEELNTLRIERMLNKLNEKKWEDYNLPKGEWYDVPVEDIRQGALDRGGEVNIADELYALIYNSYKDIGGHLKIPNAAALPAKYTDWVAIDTDDDPEPDALRFSKGPKMTGSGTDGTRKAIDAYLLKTAELLHEEGFYAEMSKAIAHIMITRHHVPYVPNKDDAARVLGKKIKWIGAHPEGKYPGYDGWYERDIGGKTEMKIMVGRPKGIKVVQP